MPRGIELAPAEEVFRWAITEYGPGFGVFTSFQDEGMVMVDMAARIDLRVRVVTIDTGRLPDETHRMMEEVRGRYGVSVEVVLPDAREVAEMVGRHGANLFYESKARRALCCQIRKVRPLEEKLKEFRAWAVGLRRGQSETRRDLLKIEEQDGRVKLSPLVDWTRQQVDAYLVRNDVPRHPLYAWGYRSIGCDPCTRAVEVGGAERSGRWWWENDSAKECGIHFSADGRAQREVDILLDEILHAQGIHTMVHGPVGGRKERDLRANRGAFAESGGKS